MKHEQKSKYARCGNIQVYIQRRIPQKWTLKTILKQLELVKSFSSFASIVINLLSIETRKTDAESRDIPLNASASEECRSIIFTFQCFWYSHVQRLWREDDTQPNFSANICTSRTQPSGNNAVLPYSRFTNLHQ
jgi:hypothetical protein